MKKLIALSFIALSVCSCQNAGRGTAWGAGLGGISGAVIGHNHHRKTAEGAAIGTAVGATLGYIFDSESSSKQQPQQRRQRRYTGDPLAQETVRVKRRVIVEEDVPVEKEVHVRKYYVDPNTGQRVYVK